MLKISVITASYNRAKFLPDTIVSVQRSKLTPLRDISIEHIIYDDGSQDRTLALLESLTYDNTIYLSHSENRGQAFARNQAIKFATGDYLFILDSDDVILERALYNFSRLALQHPEVSWFTSDFLRVDSQLRYLNGQDYYGWQFNSCLEMLQAIFKGQHFLQGNVFVKREVFVEVGGYDDTLHMAEDLDLYIRLALAGYLPHYSTFMSHLHRSHVSNISKDVTVAKHLVDVNSLKHKYSSELAALGIA